MQKKLMCIRTKVKGNSIQQSLLNNKRTACYLKYIKQFVDTITCINSGVVFILPNRLSFVIFYCNVFMFNLGRQHVSIDVSKCNCRVVFLLPS